MGKKSKYVMMKFAFICPSTTLAFYFYNFYPHRCGIKVEMHLQLPLTRFVFWQANQNMANGNMQQMRLIVADLKSQEGKTVLLYLDQANS